MEIKSLSNKFDVRKLGETDIESIFELSSENKLFYQYHPPFVTRESIRKDMEALPPGKNNKDKYYIGFFEKGTLVAIMDLILNYPADDTAFIGLFMMHPNYQGSGTGSGIIAECAGFLLESGFKKIRLGIDKGNPQSSAFWKKNGFVTIEENKYIIMERIL